MAESAVGRAALVLTTDASGARSGLAKFGADARVWAEKTGNQLSSQFRGAFLAGGVAGLVGGSLSGGVSENVEAIKSWAFGMADVRARTEGLKELLDQTAFLMERNAKQADAWRAAMKPGEQLKDINKELADVKRRSQGFTDQVAALRAQKAEIESSFGQQLGGRLGFLPTRERLEDINQQLAAFHQALGTSQKRMDELRESTQRLKNVFDFKNVKPDIDKMTADLEAANRAIGIDPIEATLKELRMRMKVTDFDKLIPLENLMRQNKELTERNDRLKDFDSLLVKLKDDARFLGMEADAVAIERLGERGLEAFRVAELKAALAAKRRTEQFFDIGPAIAGGVAGTKPRVEVELKFDNAALAKGTSAEVSARVRNEFGTMPQQQLAEAKKGNTLLTEIRDAAKAIGTAPGGPDLSPL